MSIVRVSTLTDRWQRLLADAGWTQAELARRLGISNTAVSNWVHVRHQPDAPQMLKLAELLGVSEDVLRHRLYDPADRDEYEGVQTGLEPELRLQCLALALQRADQHDDAETILGTAQRFVSWVAQGRQPLA